MELSVVIPIKDNIKNIDKCLNSIYKETYKDFEIIIISSSIKDTNHIKIKKYEKKYSLLKVININDIKDGVLNVAIKEAKGRYITFINPNDFIDPIYFEEMINKIEQTDDDIIYTDYYLYNSHSSLTLKKNSGNKLFINNDIWGKLYKTQIFKKYKLWFSDNKYNSNYSVIPTLLALSKTSYIPLPLYYYNYKLDSTIIIDDLFLSVDELIYNFKKHKIYTKYKDELEYIYLKTFISDITKYLLKTKYNVSSINRLRDKVLDYFPNILDNKYYNMLNIKIKNHYKMLLSRNPLMLYYFSKLSRRIKNEKNTD